MRSAGELALIASIADDLPAGIWVATAPDGRFVYANRAFEEIMGTGPITDVLAGEYAKPYSIFTRDGRPYPEDRMPFVRALQARATVVVDDLVIHRHDGRRVYVRASAKPALDANGTITHIAIVFFDITREVEAEEERTRAKAKEAEVREQLSRVVENAPIILFCFDPNGVVSFAQGHGLRRLGWDPRDVLGRSVFDLFREVPAVCEHARRALSGETGTQRLEMGQARSAVFDTWLTPLQNEAGQLTGVLGVSTDVTDQRRMEAQLERAERLASVGMLAAGVAHEINNPLSYVVANLDLLIAELGKIEDPALQHSVEEKILDARQGAKRVSTIVKDLRVFAGAEESRHGVADVRAALDGALKIANNEIRHRARLVLDCSPVPAVGAEPGRLAQLFLNLLVNAAQSIPEGSAEQNEIRVSTVTDEKGWAKIEIKDTGGGISEDTLPRIFDPFFTTKPMGIGTGLGLSISHAIAVAAGGRIEVESRLGTGSTFQVLFPPAPRASAPEVEVVAAAPPRATDRPRVLVIDDELLILKVIASMLESEYDVTCEFRVDAALGRIRRGERFDAILCDLMMPHMTGMDLYATLLEIAPDQASSTIFLTGGAFTPRAREFLEKVSRATIKKPFDTATLLNELRQHIATLRARSSDASGPTTSG